MVARGTGFVVALILAATLATRGIDRWEAAMAIALVAAALAAATPTSREPARWLEATVLACSMALLGSNVASIDRPGWLLGIDAPRYLGNALAVAEARWSEYQTWRAPGYAWTTLALTPAAGSLVAASRWVSTLCVVAVVPLTWVIGRATVGPWPALYGAALVGGWPDLAAFGVFSTPYAQMSALVLGGIACACRPGWRWAVASGVVFALGVATDLRVGVVAVAVAGAMAIVAVFEASRATLLSAALVAAIGVGGGTAIVRTLPVELRPLGEQIALQRDLNAREGIGGCKQAGKELPRLADVFGECGRTTFRANLRRAGRAAPFGLLFMATFAAIGLRSPRAGRATGTLLLLAPVIPELPALAIVGVQHRYALPFVPLAALLAANGLDRLAGGGRALAGCVVAVWILAWNDWNGTLFARVRGDPGASFAADLGSGGYTGIAARLAAVASPGQRIIDCAGAELDLRLYPREVEDVRPARGRVHARCRRLLEQGAANAWLFVELDGPAPAPWVVDRTAGRGDGATVALLRAAP